MISYKNWKLSRIFLKSFQCLFESFGRSYDEKVSFRWLTKTTVLFRYTLFHQKLHSHLNSVRQVSLVSLFVICTCFLFTRGYAPSLQLMQQKRSTWLWFTKQQLMEMWTPWLQWSERILPSWSLVTERVNEGQACSQEICCFSLQIELSKFFILIFVFSELYLVPEYGKFELFFGTATGNAVWIIPSPCNSKIFLYDYK